MIAVALSIVFPGLGQLYFGKLLRAAVMILLGATPLYPVALVWSAIDAYRLSRGGSRPQFSNREALGAVALLVVAVPLGIAALGVTTVTTLRWLSDSYLDRRATQREGAEIAATVVEYQVQTGHYPENLAALAAGRPLRQEWLVDGWRHPYQYRVEGFGL